jgi:hypothetical protein
MITIKRFQTTTIQVYLNPTSLNELENVSLRLISPSRSTITLDKSLTKISTGFYSFETSSLEADQLKDDTYSYQILQGETILKYGFVRLAEGNNVLNIVFDYTLDFLLS